MAIADTVKSFFGISPKMPVYVPVTHQRKFTSAKNDRLTADWILGGSNINEDIKNDLAKLRMRARDLVENNDYAKHFIRLLKVNVVGAEGIRLQNKAKDNNGRLDKMANDLIEAAWKEWCKKRNCTVSGRYTFREVLNQALETVARDGEFFLRKVRNFDNKYKFALQMIDPALVDEKLNVQLSNGNDIIMGIEIDSWGRPVAYHVKENEQYYSRTHRIPANEITHLFVPMAVNAVRSVTWFHTAAKRMHMIDGYEEAELVASRTAAAKMGFYTSNVESGAEYVGDDKTDDGDLISEVSPGVFEVLPQGMDFKEFDPDHPTSQFGDFMKGVLRGVSAGLGISYSSLAQDLSDANYSSMRTGLLQDRDVYKELQTWLIEHVCEDVFESWLEMSLLSGAISLPFAKFDKFNSPSFRPRGWSWVDPQKDTKATVEGLKNKIRTRTEVAAEQGRDIEEIFQELEHETQLAKKYNLDVDGGEK